MSNLPNGTFEVIFPQTAAATSNPYDASNYDTIVVSADNLAGGETVTLQVIAGVTPVQVAQLDGTPVNLTATVPSVVLEGGTSYQFVKSATAGLCGVYVGSKRL